MKKEYLIGLLTGCLLSASALMFMGATNNSETNWTTIHNGAEGVTFFINEKGKVYAPAIEHKGLGHMKINFIEIKEKENKKKKRK